MKITVVVPTIRENSIQRFLSEWNVHFAKAKAHVLVVEDNPDKTFAINQKEYGFSVTHFSWNDIEKDLGNNAWIIPRRSSAIKAYGFMKAYKMKSDVIISLDDDCYPLEKYIPKLNKKNFIASHIDALYTDIQSEDAWFSTIKISGDIRPRGLPYKKTQRKIRSEKIILNHGLWANVPDFDGTTQIKFSKFPHITNYFLQALVPQNVYFPMCGMNIAWKRELTPALYFMLMGKNTQEKSWGFDRFDDIWAGIFTKKICDHLGYRITSGAPTIWHDRASNPITNIKKERTGVVVNEKLWESVDSIVLTKTSVIECYKELAKKLPADTDYFRKLKKAMVIWADLF